MDPSWLRALEVLLDVLQPWVGVRCEQGTEAAGLCPGAQELQPLQKPLLQIQVRTIFPANPGQSARAEVELLVRSRPWDVGDPPQKELCAAPVLPAPLTHCLADFTWARKYPKVSVDFSHMMELLPATARAHTGSRAGSMLP